MVVIRYSQKKEFALGEFKQRFRIEEARRVIESGATKKVSHIIADKLQLQIGHVNNMSGNQGSVNNTFSNSNIAAVNTGTGNITNVSQYIGVQINEINSLIESLQKTAQEFPEGQREEALIHLEDLQEVISKPEKQKSPRIKALLLALLAVGTMVVGGNHFINQLSELSEKLHVPIEHTQPQPTQQLPQSTLGQIDLQSQGINRAQAEILRANLTTFADDWNSPEMSIYDNYDAARANLQTR